MLHSRVHATTSAWHRIYSSLSGILFRNSIRLEDDLNKEPKRLASLVGPICAQMLTQLRYPGAPQLKGEAVEALLEYMYTRAVEIGVPLDTPISSKGFRLGYAEGLVGQSDRFLEDHDC